MEKYSYSELRRQQITEKRKERIRQRNTRLAIIALFCLSLIAAIGALSYVVKHADEFENIRCAEAAGLSDSKKNDNSNNKNNKNNNNINNDNADNAEDDDEWMLTLVNSKHPIHDDYKPELMELSNGQQVDSRIYPDLQKMFDDMRSEGLSPVVASGYRTKGYQEQLLNEKIEELLARGYSEEDSEAEAKTWVAVPGTSEHHLGLAIDINSDLDVNNPDPAASEVELQQWLKDNSYRYGFILRYPLGKEKITGVNYEPWHFRYVGVENAEKIYESGLTLEEYLEK